MIPAAFDYARATSVDEVLAALAADDGTQLIAGGHSLLPILKFRLADPSRLLDIAHLDALRGVHHKGGAARIGATTTYRELLDSAALRKSHPLIAEATSHIGDVQVRNRGTIGGGLAHADPASDMPAVMLALDASFTLQSKGGERAVPAREFFTGPFDTAMKSNELLTAIDVPALAKGSGSAYVSFDQAASGYALVGAAAVVALKGGKVTRADLAFTGLSENPFLTAGAKDLVGSDGGEAACSKVASACISGVEANDDIHASAAYRTHLAVVAARRALTTAVARSA